MTHPITPPSDLVEQWDDEGTEMFRPEYQLHLTTRAAQWGADQELEACVKLLELSDKNARDFLYSARRPKPPSLKAQALQALRQVGNCEEIDNVTFETIRCALEQLDD